MKKILFILFISVVSSAGISSCTEEVVAPTQNTGTTGTGTTGNDPIKP